MSQTSITGDNNIVVKDIKGEVVNIIINGNALPADLLDNLVTDDNQWSKGLAQAIRNQQVSVSNNAIDIYQHYGWLIEAFLQKLSAKIDKNKAKTDAEKKAMKLRRLSFMTEAFQSSLRYLCYIQVAQIFHLPEPPKCPKAIQLLQCSDDDYQQFDFLHCLYETTDALGEERSFVPQIVTLVEQIRENEDDLGETVKFMSGCRNQLINNNLNDLEHLDNLLEGFLTGLVHWLKQLAFLAKYRLISIKDISLNYRLGSVQKTQFMHHYGELHGMYNTMQHEGGDYYNIRAVDDVFTYNQSVLLLNAKNVDDGLDKIHDPTIYLSLSPLIIDKSVFANKITQTPEIHYYIGRKGGKSKYTFAHYKDELSLDGQPLKSNKPITVLATNTKDTKLDELFSQIKDVFGKQIK